MAWGGAFQSAWDKASATAKAAVSATMSSASEAAASVSRVAASTSSAGKQAAVGAVKSIAQVAKQAAAPAAVSAQQAVSSAANRAATQVGQWGSVFDGAWNKASAVAKAAATKTMSSASAAAESVARVAGNTATAAKQIAAAGVIKAKQFGAAAKEAAVTTGSLVKQGLIKAGRALDTTARAFVAGVDGLASGLVVGPAVSLYASVKARMLGSPPTVLLCQSKQPVDVFSREYRKSLVNSRFEGQDKQELRDAMNALRADISEEEAAPHLETLASLRKRPIEEIRAEYAKYLEARQRQDDHLAATGQQPDPQLELKPEQASHMGSVWQLRYGKVVGDAVGMDPVFAAMLNPTGGIVGAGNEEKKGIFQATATKYHGAYHDAMGNLYNNSHLYSEEENPPPIGPGYNYMNAPIDLDTGNPYAGQGPGIREFASFLF